MFEKNWINGKYFSKDERLVSISLGAIHYGISAFEGILCVCVKQPAIFRLKEHIDRFFYSAQALGFGMPYSKEEFSEIVKDIVWVNGRGSYYLRPIVFRKSDFLDLAGKDKRLSVAVLCKRFNFTAFLLQMQRRIKAIISKNVRSIWGDYLVKAKISGKYLISVIAKLEANKSGLDDAILLDGRNMVSEATTANAFIVKDGVIKIPFLNNTLSGITQDSVITIARDLGYKVTEDDIAPDELYNADEVFLTSTAEGITSISKVDNNIIGKKNKVTTELRANYIDIIRSKNSKYANWLTPVDMGGF